ncbi:hypothetical protein [uncultured Thiodictyon sp.]|uniref:hypothetical protein n=1 Tax=uncultured Thiodictyon sp. TaxID=1846217 RepID=UPI0025E60453|nr:hypothetical protein [uncultured Thiodictyon sp.]
MSKIPLEQVAQAIEADAGEEIAGLRESLAEMAADERGRTYTREQLALRAARTALGLSQPAFARLLQTPVGHRARLGAGALSAPRQRVAGGTAGG